MASIDQKLEAWKSKLLDLGKRNRLLNYHDTKRSSLRIKNPTIFALWDSFVENEMPLEFPYYDDEHLSDFENGNSEVSEASIVTNQTIREQQKTLRSLREKAKTAMEEQGVNILYLTFGFLRWRENEHSEQYLLSPIVLVPVTLALESITSPFILGLHEDEITLNPTLMYKLSSDFGINLPEFDSDNGIQSYLNGIDDLIKKQKWEVVYDSGFSLLSFLKINMYRDLDTHQDTIKSNPIVRALSGDATAIERTYENINNFDHDSATIPSELFQVIDADSSQQDAVLMAKKGISFVLQGPPGTGKSQTITNIIAECLASGKKVLFVSEKMAALEVVRKRLAAAGLADFCLTLHSYKANKKEVLEQLGVTLNLSKQQAKLSDEAFQKLDLLQDRKEELNEYARQIFEIVEPLGKTIYQINGYLANLESYDNVVFDLPDVIQTTTQKYNRYINLLGQFASTISRESSDYTNNPWYGADIPILTNELRHDIKAYLSRLLPKIKKASEICDKISTELCLDGFSSYTEMESLREILAFGAQSPKVPIDWVVKDDVARLQDDIKKYDKLQHDYQKLQHELAGIISGLSVNDSDVLFSDPLLLTTTLHINAEEHKVNQLVLNDYCYSTWENGHYIKAQSLYEQARQKVQTISGLRENIATTFEREIFDIDYKSILNRFKTEYTSFLKVFKGQYKADKKAILGLHKQVTKKISDAEVISILTLLKQIDEASCFLQEQRQNLEKYFGDRYVLEQTDFDALSRSLKTFNCIQQFREKIVLLNDLAKTIEKQDSEMRRQFGFHYNGILTDWESVSQSLTWAINLKDIYIKYGINKKFVEFVCSDDTKIFHCSEYCSILSECVMDLDVEFSWYLNHFETVKEIKNIPMPAFYDRIQLSDNLALLEEWIDFRNTRTNCQKEGLTDYVSKIQQLNIEAEYIIPVFRKRFYRLWLDAVLPSYPAVLNFRRRIQEQTINEFIHLDRLQFEIAKARIKKTLIDALPSFDRVASGVDELNILKREFGKQRRILPIRKLFRAIPNLLLTLKPCLMMSPLSVSLFLEAERYNFDTVIFDEASQVCTENAIGAIARGKQVIIAGDSKQLPPTNFFSVSISDADYDSEDEEDEFDDPNAYESILDEATLLPERTLLWHYRSRHEHLIAFSNAKIYRNNLITFPANVDKAPDNGVEYIYVSGGFYD